VVLKSVTIMGTMFWHAKPHSISSLTFRRNILLPFSESKCKPRRQQSPDYTVSQKTVVTATRTSNLTEENLQFEGNRSNWYKGKCFFFHMSQTFWLHFCGWVGHRDFCVAGNVAPRVTSGRIVKLASYLRLITWSILRNALPSRLYMPTYCEVQTNS
jgi:hypothetical protein